MPVEIRLKDEISVGAATFDIAPHFPCFVAFLDASNGLVVRRKESNIPEPVYERIGLAEFLKPSPARRKDFKPPPVQVATQPGHIKMHGPNDTFGPMTNAHPKTVICIE